ncbi:hypothetical protein K0M31_008552 [Melipona bicolor]|uniref:Uncharacterized protein n=1 Tax=Melipona bicolor TaxID=60889 RepID=A0AA40FR94_9HYME|nr:hypothetical protein K0M31_008552 [Melipona bicolor]
MRPSSLLVTLAGRIYAPIALKGLISVKLDLLTNLPTNLNNGELLTNNDAHKTSQDVEEKEEVEIEDETAKAGF